MKAITYVGSKPGYIAKFRNRVYEFEWQKSLPVGGGRTQEVRKVHALKLSLMKDSHGRKIFRIE